MLANSKKKKEKKVEIVEISIIEHFEKGFEQNLIFMAIKKFQNRSFFTLSFICDNNKK